MVGPLGVYYVLVRSMYSDQRSGIFLSEPDEANRLRLRNHRYHVRRTTRKTSKCARKA